MNAEIDGPVGVTSSRRRGSTIGSTGLDYSSCHRVDEDIISRIRSLLLSRNDHRPPRTPCPSDEHNYRCSELEDTVGGFDFSTAQSVAKIARRETGRLSTPDIGKVSATSIEMEPQKAPRASLPSIKFAAPRSHSSSSANDLKVHVDVEGTIQSHTTVESDPDFPSEKKPRFKLPKLVLQDKRRVTRKVKSCMDINPPIPEDDDKIHETELLCCPPCDPNDVPKSKYTTNYPRWPGGMVRAVPGDLACFLAGCPPSHLECRKHHRRQNPQHSIHDRRLAEDFKGVADGIAQDIARLGHSLKDVKVWSKDRLGAQQIPKPNVEGQGGRFGSDGGKGAPAISVKPPTSNSEEASEPEICSSVTSTSDAFPHAFQSMELVANETTPHRFSTTVSTNFSLPGYKSRPDIQLGPRPSKQEPRQPPPPIDTSPMRTVTFSPPGRTSSGISPKNSMPTKEPEIPLASRSKPESKPPSILSSSSRRSASARHALLKPSVTEAQPVDTGLPIPPVLSPISTIPEQALPELPDYYQPSKGVSVMDFGKGGKEADMVSSAHAANPPPLKETGLDVSKPQEATLGDVQATTASPVVGHVASVRNAEDLLQGVQSRVEGARVDTQPRPVCPQSPPPTIVKAKAAVDPPQTVPKSSQSPPPDNNRASAMETLAAVSESDSLNAAYWGFIPTIKETVQDAVQVAVRNAVETTVPPGIEKGRASDAYRKVVARSLAEAAKTADDYLRSASLWNEPPSSIRGSESTVILGPGKQVYDSLSNIGDPPAERMRRLSVTSKENVETYGNELRNLALSVDEMDTVPLVTADKPKPRKKTPQTF
ncbi:hypothetical protein F5882DRAFT_472233 [Hyaloscypha sp. PMI_1271]|nr:hypothetical protein F5882DRAFT_472233 [Hyaloscypha sp. PMI_1271]